MSNFPYLPVKHETKNTQPTYVRIKLFYIFKNITSKHAYYTVCNDIEDSVEKVSEPIMTHGIGSWSLGQKPLLQSHSIYQNLRKIDLQQHIEPSYSSVNAHTFVPEHRDNEPEEDTQLLIYYEHYK